LLARGHHDPGLVMAALLHDVAKGEQRRADRVAYVVASRLGLAHVLASRRSRFAVRRAVARSLAHAATGARVLEEAGVTEEVVRLTRLHHGPPGDDPVLALLQMADARS
jgi:UTP:GlnB (protein PII) uridylyltransferase